MRQGKLFPELLVVAVCGFFAAPVAAAPVTFFSGSITQVYADSQNCTSSACSQAPSVYQNSINTSGGAASSSSSFTFTEGLADASGSADLSTGQLKSFSSVDSTASFSNLGASTVSIFGDSFRTYNSNGTTPFNWTSSSQASFSFDLSGIVNLGLGAVNASSFFLNVYAPGALDAVAATYSAGGGALPPSIFSAEYSLGANNILDSYPFITSNISTFPTTQTVTFNPMGDFDWVIGLVTNTSRNTSGQALMDFSNTLTASYSGPLNSVTYSASGLFPGTPSVPAPVPLPAGFPLLAAGLGALGFLRRKKRNMAVC